MTKTQVNHIFKVLMTKIKNKNNLKQKKFLQIIKESINNPISFEL